MNCKVIKSKIFRGFCCWLMLWGISYALSPPPPPEAPESCKARALSSSSVEVQWAAQAARYINGYYIYRDGKKVGKTTPNQLTFKDVGLKASTTYVYYVRAYDIIDFSNVPPELGGPIAPFERESALSPIAKVKTLAAGNGARNLVGVRLNPTTIKLSWEPPLIRIAIKEYRIVMGPDAHSWKRIHTVPGNVLSTVLSRVPMSTVQLQVRAITAAGSKLDMSDPVFVPPYTATGLIGAHQLKALRGSNGQVSMKWLAPPDKRYLVKYQIFMAKNLIVPFETSISPDPIMPPYNPWILVATVDKSKTNYLMSRAPTTKFYLKVQAVSNGPSKYLPSNTVTVNSSNDNDTTPPSVPSGLRLVSKSSRHVSIQWNPSKDDRPGKITYHVHTAHHDVIEVSETTSLLFTDGNLTPNTYYSYTVMAEDKAGNKSRMSIPLRVKTDGNIGFLEGARNVAVNRVTPAEAKVSWDAPLAKVKVHHYLIYVKNGDFDPIPEPIPVPLSSGQAPSSPPPPPYHWRLAAKVPGYMTTATLRTLTKNEFSLYVQAVSGSIRFEKSEIVDVPPFGQNHPGAHSLKGLRLGSTTIRLSWQAPTGNPLLKEYGIVLGTNEKSWRRVATVSGTTTSIVLTSKNRISTSTALLQVRAVLANGKKLPISEQIAVLPYRGNPTLPTTPENLTVTGSTTTSISLKWSPSSSHIGIAGYRILRNGNVIGTTSKTAFTDSGLKPYSEYRYAVRAYDKAGNQSVLSQPVTGKTRPGIIIYPPPPQGGAHGLQAEWVNHKSLKLTWHPPVGNPKLKEYGIVLGPNEKVWRRIKTVSGTTLETILPAWQARLRPDQVMYLQVRAILANGQKLPMSEQLKVQPVILP